MGSILSCKEKVNEIFDDADNRHSTALCFDKFSEDLIQVCDVELFQQGFIYNGFLTVSVLDRVLPRNQFNEKVLMIISRPLI